MAREFTSTGNRSSIRQAINDKPFDLFQQNVVGNNLWRQLKDDGFYGGDGQKGRVAVEVAAVDSSLSTMFWAVLPDLSSKGGFQVTNIASNDNPTPHLFSLPSLNNVAVGDSIVLYRFVTDKEFSQENQYVIRSGNGWILTSVATSLKILRDTTSGVWSLWGYGVGVSTDDTSLQDIAREVDILSAIDSVHVVANREVLLSEEILAALRAGSNPSHDNPFVTNTIVSTLATLVNAVSERSGENKTDIAVANTAIDTIKSQIVVIKGLLESRSSESVILGIISTPPESPSSDDYYIVGENPTGWGDAVVEQDSKVVYRDGAWLVIPVLNNELDLLRKVLANGDVVYDFIIYDNTLPIGSRWKDSGSLTDIISMLDELSSKITLLESKSPTEDQKNALGGDTVDRATGSNFYVTIANVSNQIAKAVSDLRGQGNVNTLKSLRELISSLSLSDDKRLAVENSAATADNPVISRSELEVVAAHSIVYAAITTSSSINNTINTLFVRNFAPYVHLADRDISEPAIQGKFYLLNDESGAYLYEALAFSWKKLSLEGSGGGSGSPTYPISDPEFSNDLSFSEDKDYPRQLPVVRYVSSRYRYIQTSPITYEPDANFRLFINGDDGVWYNIERVSHSGSGVLGTLFIRCGQRNKPNGGIYAIGYIKNDQGTTDLGSITSTSGTLSELQNSMFFAVFFEGDQATLRLNSPISLKDKKFVIQDASSNSFSYYPANETFGGAVYAYTNILTGTQATAFTGEESVALAELPKDASFIYPMGTISPEADIQQIGLLRVKSNTPENLAREIDKGEHDVNDEGSVVITSTNEYEVVVPEVVPSFSSSPQTFTFDTGEPQDFTTGEFFARRLGESDVYVKLDIANNTDPNRQIFSARLRASRVGSANGYGNYNTVLDSVSSFFGSGRFDLLRLKGKSFETMIHPILKVSVPEVLVRGAIGIFSSSPAALTTSESIYEPDIGFIAVTVKVKSPNGTTSHENMWNPPYVSTSQRTTTFSVENPTLSRAMNISVVLRFTTDYPRTFIDATLTATNINQVTLQFSVLFHLHKDL